MTTPYSFELKRDSEDRIVEKIETVAGKPSKWTYAYDKAGRLSEAKLDGRLICQCHYDKRGRRIQDYFPHLSRQVRQYRYSMDDRLQQAGNNGYTHDKSGFRSIWNTGGKYTTYEYAPDCRLLKSTNEATGTVFEFEHDDNGQRRTKHRNGQLSEAYIWLDFIRLAAFHDGKHMYEFIYDGDERTPHMLHRDDDKIMTLHYDQVGSLRVVADPSNNVIKEIRYDPFGNILEDTNPALRLPLGFAGGLHDRDLDLIRFGWRDYDPFTSRWTAPDPMGDAGGDDDWYGYCLDAPVNGVDPLGLYYDAAYVTAVNAMPSAIRGIQRAMLGMPTAADALEYGWDKLAKPALEDYSDAVDKNLEEKRKRAIRRLREREDRKAEAARKNAKERREMDAKRESALSKSRKKTLTDRSKKALDRAVANNNSDESIGDSPTKSWENLKTTFAQYREAKGTRGRSGSGSASSGNIGSREGSYNDYGR